MRFYCIIAQRKNVRNWIVVTNIKNKKNLDKYRENVEKSLNNPDTTKVQTTNTTNLHGAIHNVLSGPSSAYGKKNVLKNAKTNIAHTTHVNASIQTHTCASR